MQIGTITASSLLNQLEINPQPENNACLLQRMCEGPVLAINHKLIKKICEDMFFVAVIFPKQLVSKYHEVEHASVVELDP